MGGCLCACTFVCVCVHKGGEGGEGGNAYWVGVCVQAHLCVCVCAFVYVSLCVYACMCVFVQSVCLLVCSVSVQKNKETVLTKRWDKCTHTFSISF